MNKLSSYIGFAIKARKVVFGYDNITYNKSRYMVILYDDTLSDKVIDKALRLAHSKGWYIYKTDSAISSIINRNCKILGITDVSLGNAIIKYIKGEI